MPPPMPMAPDLPAPVPLAASEIDDVDVPPAGARPGLRADQLDATMAGGAIASGATPPIGAGSDDPDVIREQIERTREDMSQTINELQERLSPQHLAQQARASVREATVGRVQHLVGTAGDSASQAARRAQEAAAPLVEQARQHPMSVGLASAGVGLVWWMMRRSSGAKTWSRDDMYDWDDDDMMVRGEYGTTARRDQDGDAWRDRRGAWGGMLRENPVPAAIAAASIGYMLWTRRSGMVSDDMSTWSADGDSYAGGTTAAVADKAREMRRQARETASSVGEQVSETVRDAQAKAGEVSRAVSRRWDTARVQTSTQFERWMQENPMAVGVAALAAGAVLGLSVPRSRVEDRTLGATRDALVDKASESAQQLTSQVREKVQEMADKATSEDAGATPAPGASSSSIGAMGAGM
ncbi:hypothetical protein TBR22_A29680 [Luteitalea sp. TBR-22]|nr:hypothetical protein TBR22_A29680 [Luteitalea sp. TBR-22]